MTPGGEMTPGGLAWAAPEADVLHEVAHWPALLRESMAKSFTSKASSS